MSNREREETGSGKLRDLGRVVRALPLPVASEAAALALLCGAITGVLFTYRESFAGLVETWVNDSTYLHCSLILPITAWLVWRRRADLRLVHYAPSGLGAVGLIGATGAWAISHLSGVQAAEQFAVVAMIPACVVGALGVPAARIIAFPLGFLFFAVPVGGFLVPTLMRFTADIAAGALQLSGIPTLRSQMYISVPAGDFEVAKACSGLNYLLAGLVLGALYSHLTFQKSWKRAICVGLFVAVLVLANGLRAFLTILVSEKTSMTFGPGMEHVELGRVLFVAVVFLMFWIGHRFADSVKPLQLAPAVGTGPWKAASIAAFVLALVVIISGPSAAAIMRVRADEIAAREIPGLCLPPAKRPWVQAVSNRATWVPIYPGNVRSLVTSFTRADGAHVSVYIGVFALGRRDGAEMVSDQNRIADDEGRSLISRRSVGRETSGLAFAVTEIEARAGGVLRLVWSWYDVDGFRMTDDVLAKLGSVAALVHPRRGYESVILLSTDAGPRARETLSGFLRSQARSGAYGAIEGPCGTRNE